MAAAFAVLYFASLAAAQPQLGIGAAINRTAAILDTANQSGYLIFYPNLTQAYADYYRAVNISANASNYTETYALLNRSAYIAGSEEARISAYSGYSVVVLAVLGAATAVVLYRFMAKRGG